MDPGDVRGDAVSPPEPDVAIGAVATGEEAHWLQMGLQSQGRAFRAGMLLLRLILMITKQLKGYQCFSLEKALMLFRGKIVILPKP